VLGAVVVGAMVVVVGAVVDVVLVLAGPARPAGERRCGGTAPSVGRGPPQPVATDAAVTNTATATVNR
jgi:hypothetical protein